jgi:hypothetical protein
MGHFDGGHGRIEPLVAALRARPVDRLFERVAGQNPERYGDSVSAATCPNPLAASPAT